MTHREVARAHFPNLVPTLLADRTVVALTPAGPEVDWAAGVCWDIARAAARAGRRVVLIDLHLEAPMLQTGASVASEEGIVDAFVFGASLTHVAREQEPDLFYIGVGTAPVEPADVWATERWKRLGRGFASEGALMLLCIPASALPRLGVRPDGLIVIAPNGYQPDSLGFPGITDTLTRGTPLVAVVREAPPPPPPRHSRPSVSARSLRPRSRRAPPYAAAGTALAAIAAAVLVLRATGSREGSGTAGAAAPATAPPAALPLRAAPSHDSLFYSVQVAAFNTMAQALEHAARYDDAAGASTISPVRLGRQGLWYRVLVGATPTALAADSLLRRLWQQELLERPNGTILRTPHAHELGRMADPDLGRDSVARLRARGIAAYILATAGGSPRLLAGAFEEPEQAAVADSLLRRAGITPRLTQRTGTRR